MYRFVIATLAMLLLAGGASSVSATSLDEEKERLRNSAFESMADDLGLRLSATPSRELAGWGAVKKVVARYPAERVGELQGVAPGVEIVPVETLQEAVSNAEGAQAVLGFCAADLLDRGAGLHWIQVYSAGVERCVSIPAMQQGGRLLTNGQRIGSPALAEHAIAMMMTLARGLDVYHAHQARSEWHREVELGSGRFLELEGRTALVVGLGGIGTQVARRAHGLGMRVVATRGSRREGPDYVEYVGLADELLELTSQADVVINTTPLTPNTTGLFDAEFFAAMKPTAYFISVGRGRSTVTGDLVDALKAGELAGAGLDVTDPEPLPADHELWTMPRVIITPHTAGRSDRSRERLFLLVQENLRRYVAGEPLYSVVDIERGY